MVWDGIGMELALHADIWTEASWKLTIMSFLQSPVNQGQNTRPDWLSNI